jgi:hypothetical protein
VISKGAVFSAPVRQSTDRDQTRTLHNTDDIVILLPAFCLKLLVRNKILTPTEAGVSGANASVIV